jgi:hypothetical protein
MKQLWLSELKISGTTLPNYDKNVPLAALVPRQTPITAMCFDIG